LAKSRATHTIEFSLKAQSHDPATAATVGAECFPQSRVHRRKHNTNKSRQWLQRLCGAEFTHAPNHRPKPNTTTQTKAGNGCNDCAEFTHAPTSRSAKKNPATAALIMRNFRTVDTKSQ